MGLALGALLLWLGACLLWVAFHGTQAKTPWGVYQQVTGAMTGGE